MLADIVFALRSLRRHRLFTLSVCLTLAVGAPVRDIRGSVLRRGMLLTSAGVVSGTLLALVCNRALVGVIDSVMPNDPLVLALIGALVVAETDRLWARPIELRELV